MVLPTWLLSIWVEEPILVYIYKFHSEVHLQILFKDMNLSKPFHITVFELLSFLGIKIIKQMIFSCHNFHSDQAFVQLREVVV